MPDGSKSGKARIEAQIVSSSRHEPFCTVFPEQVSESRGVSKGSLPAKPARRTAGLHIAISNRLRSDKRHIASTWPKEKPMFLTSKIGWAGIAFALLTTGVLVQGFPRSSAKSNSNEKGVAAFVHKNEIKKMQETLRNRGHYRGNIDGVFGLRTRASIRAYQKAENLPINGQVDIRTAGRLGVRPESTWGNSQSAGQGIGYGSGGPGAEIANGKPSAGIRRAERRASKTSRKEVSSATAIEDNHDDGVGK